MAAKKGGKLGLGVEVFPLKGGRWFQNNLTRVGKDTSFNFSIYAKTQSLPKTALSRNG